MIGSTITARMRSGNSPRKEATQAPPSEGASPRVRVRRTALLTLLAGVIFAGAVLWMFWPSLVELAEIWESDPQYSHGYLVPVFALILLWLRRDQCSPADMRPCVWGLPVLAAGCLLRLAGGYYYYFWLDRFALLPVLLGLAVTLGGWRAVRWGWPAIAFLVFMLPLPSRLGMALGGPLQRLGTICSSYLLEVLGFPAVTEGNVILLRNTDLGIIEACSGLRMLITFFAASAAVASLVKRPLGIRLALFLSAVPIAVAVNIIRITLTGVLYETAGQRLAEMVFHDLAGWLMIPMALALLGFVYWLLNRLFPGIDLQEGEQLRISAIPLSKKN